MQILRNSHRFIFSQPFPSTSIYLSTPFICLIVSLFDWSLMCSLLSPLPFLFFSSLPFPSSSAGLNNAVFGGVWHFLHCNENESIWHLIYIPHNNLSHSVFCEGSAALQVLVQCRVCRSGDASRTHSPLRLLNYAVHCFIIAA